MRCLYKTVGNCDIYTDIYVPISNPSSASTKYPVVVGVHGGAFCLGSSSMVSEDQIEDCLSRGWIAVIPEHRLCPQVDVHEGPISDVRDLLVWIQDGELEKELSGTEETKNHAVDAEKIVAFGTSSGGTVALALGFGVKRPVAAILDLYGATNFADPFWTSPISTVKAPGVSTDFINQVYNEDPVPTRGGVSLEGQAKGPDAMTSDPRPAFSFTHIANGTLMDVVFPSKEWKKIDAVENVREGFPPTCIVHGTADQMVPGFLSQALFKKLQSAGVYSQFIDVPGEGHTFVGKMQKGSKTWDLQRLGFDFLERELEKRSV
ncbi:alpha/beta-hydrolase [Saccharata proteae CBS 121410]|uniref:Alpha/beta-hydrolase n=1 Tax=Saccharata proteae CBS 121410 TaxID=1314787 RepID=A0A9P4LRQ1_9PEZI|nr:alpha/beta-hydrolase [Saccharata proteae CBS 121410]